MPLQNPATTRRCTAQNCGASRYCPRIADGPRPQHVGPLWRTAKSQCFCAWPCAANRDGSRSAGGSVEVRRLKKAQKAPPEFSLTVRAPTLTCNASGWFKLTERKKYYGSQSCDKRIRADRPVGFPRHGGTRFGR